MTLFCLTRRTWPRQSKCACASPDGAKSARGPCISPVSSHIARRVSRAHAGTRACYGHAYALPRTVSNESVGWREGRAAESSGGRLVLAGWLAGWRSSEGAAQPHRPLRRPRRNERVCSSVCSAFIRSFLCTRHTTASRCEDARERDISVDDHTHAYREIRLCELRLIVSGGESIARARKRGTVGR